MITCASCKNRKSEEKCNSPALKGILFCGKHAKIKNPRIWSSVVKADVPAIQIQKIWRGYYLRKQISLAGPGALRRSLCHNDEDIVTFESKNNVSPLDYFAFEENNKIWWFDVRTILQHADTQLIVTNPFTRQPLSQDANQRIRNIYLFRLRTNRPILHIDSTGNLKAEDVIRQNWIHLCKILELNAFIDVQPRMFSTLNCTQFFILFSLLYADMKVWANEHKIKCSKRYRYTSAIKDTITKLRNNKTPSLSAYYASKTLLTVLNDTSDPYPICFMLMSALVRL